MLSFEKQRLWGTDQFGNDFGFLADGVGAVRMVEGEARVPAQGAIPLGTVGRGWREERSDETMVVSSRRRPSPCDLVMFLWYNKVVVQEVPRSAHSSAQRWSREGRMWEARGQQTNAIRNKTHGTLSRPHTHHIDITHKPNAVGRSVGLSVSVCLSVCCLSVCLSLSLRATRHTYTTRTEAYAAHTTQHHTTHRANAMSVNASIGAPCNRL